jgi:hypothetical protein
VSPLAARIGSPCDGAEIPTGVCLRQDVDQLNPAARGMAMYITRASPLYAQPHTCEIDVLPMDVDESRLAFHAWCSGRADGFRGAAGRLGMVHTLFPAGADPGRVHVAAIGTYANRRSQ